MKYLKNVKDYGIVLSPSKENEKIYKWDGGGVREAVLAKENGFYYLSYDGAMPGEKSDCYWNACLAKSSDLIHWEKLGPKLFSSALNNPAASPEEYKDLRSASSPWSIYADGKWHIFYVGADHCSPEGIPAFLYSTMYAYAESPESEWNQRSTEKGRGDEVCFPAGKPGEWDDVTASPGQVIKNPNYDPHDPYSGKYLMFYSGSCSGITKRSLGIARTDRLDLTDKFYKDKGDFWIKDPKPILPPEEDIENSSLFYEESSGIYWLFTNHIFNNEYTDSVWVYWSKDIEHWSADNKAVVMDASVSSWAKGAIGMPSVIQRDEKTLVLLYDGVCGSGTGHLHRHIGMAEISLPLCIV